MLIASSNLPNNNIVSDPTEADCDNDGISDKEDDRPLYYRYTTGVSYILYRPSDADYRDGGFTTQAHNLQNTLYEEYGYETMGQVVMIPIRTEAEFVDSWTNEVLESWVTGKIDNVSLMFHGRYYAIMIDSEKNENLTVSPQGMVGSDSQATDIRTLEMKTIDTIDLISCNNGLINAIDVVMKMHCRDEDDKENLLIYEGDFYIQGNVAQAFLETQNVSKVYAFDGSVSMNKKTGEGRLAFKQHIMEYIEELEEYSIYTPLRNKAGMVDVALGRFGGYCPGDEMAIGEVLYYKDDTGNMYCEFEYIYMDWGSNLIEELMGHYEKADIKWISEKYEIGNYSRLICGKE